MTLEDLKNNRNEILSEITKEFGKVDVKEFMTSMVNMLPMCESDNVIGYVNEVGDLMYDNKRTITMVDVENFNEVQRKKQIQLLY